MKNINLNTIRIDGGTQSRVRLDGPAVADYTEVLKGGGELPPVVVFFDGSDNWLADGFHRYHAYQGDKRASIPADVFTGTLRDAMLFSFSANGAHGLRRTKEDKRQAVAAMLADPEWSAWSDREIARQCAVSNQMVSDHRSSLSTNDSEKSEKPRTYKTKHGTEAVMNTAHIGRQETAAEAPAAALPPEDYGPDAEELAAGAASEQADRDAVALILSSDEPLAAMVEKNKILAAQVVALTARIAGLQNANNEHIRTIKGLRRKLEKMEQAA